MTFPYAQRGIVNDFDQVNREFRNLGSDLDLEPWNDVGGSNRAQFADSFLNWSSDSTRTNAGFRKNSFGLVSLKGFVTAGSAPGANTDIFYLPVGHRPIKDISFLCMGYDGSTTGPVKIDLRLSDGAVNFTDDLTLTWNTTNNTSWVDLCSISFYLDTD